MLNKLTVSELAELSKLSKAYISQVKHGKRLPSKKLLDALVAHTKRDKPEKDYFALFIESRNAMGASPKTIRFYKERLSKFANDVNYLKASRASIQRYLNTIPPNRYGLATRHASFRAIKTFYRWLHSEYGISNPIDAMSAPILGKPILPSLEQSQVLYLIEHVSNVRDNAIIALFAESGLRLSELVNIRPEHIDWFFWGY